MIGGRKTFRRCELLTKGAKSSRGGAVLVQMYTEQFVGRVEELTKPTWPQSDPLLPSRRLPFQRRRRLASPFPFPHLCFDVCAPCRRSLLILFFSSQQTLTLVQFSSCCRAWTVIAEKLYSPAALPPSLPYAIVYVKSRKISFFLDLPGFDLRPRLLLARSKSRQSSPKETVARHLRHSQEASSVASGVQLISHVAGP